MTSHAEPYTSFLVKSLMQGKEIGSITLKNGEVTKANKCKKIFSLVLSIKILIVPIVIGALYKDDCPVEPMIPMWCIVHGSTSMMSSFMQLFIVLRGDHHKKTSVLVYLTHAAKTLLFIVGCVYTYRNYEPEYKVPEGGIILGETYSYCHKTLYQFTFWYITAHFILAFVAFFCGCCCGALACCLIKISLNRNKNNNAENQIRDIENHNAENIKLNMDAENQNTVVENQTAVVENQTAVVENQTVVVENQTVVVENQNVVVENQNVFVENQNVVVENQNVVVENQNVVVENRTTVVEK